MITLNRKVRFSHPDFSYSGTAYTEYLFGSVGLKVNADIRVDVEWKIEAVNMTFDGAADTVEILDGISSWITEGFQVGDTIVFTGTVSNNTIYYNGPTSNGRSPMLVLDGTKGAGGILFAFNTCKSSTVGLNDAAACVEIDTGVEDAFLLYNRAININTYVNSGTRTRIVQ